jgi:large subunit ribosomal protein L32
MAHPKRKISKTRRDKRRTHDGATARQLALCSVTGETHQMHRAYVVDGNLYYNNKMVVANYKTA